MPTNRLRVVLVALVGLFVVAAPRAAAAGPSAESIDALFERVGFELRGFSGVARLGTGFVNGGDARLVLQGAHGGFFFGGRFGAAGRESFNGPRGGIPTSAQFISVDVGGRGYLKPQATMSFFLGGGLTYTTHYVDGFAFRFANAAGIFGEAGLEGPRTSGFRFTGALRLEGATQSRAAFSRIATEPVGGMVTLNLGIFFGGAKTGVHD
jgi:hypothetical protein